MTLGSTIRSIFGLQSKSAGNDSLEAPATMEKDTSDESSDESDESTGISRPPGWEPLYGTYDKPVFPTEDRRLCDLLESLDRAADISNYRTHLPPMGTNKEHIELYLYTVGEKEGSRTLVYDVYIHDFSEWLPEEKGSYEYPEKQLGNNGPYYMHLSRDFQNVFRVGPFAFNFVEYDEEADMAIYSAEKDLMVIDKLDTYY